MQFHTIITHDLIEQILGKDHSLLKIQINKIQYKIKIMDHIKRNRKKNLVSPVNCNIISQYIRNKEELELDEDHALHITSQLMVRNYKFSIKTKKQSQ